MKRKRKDGYTNEEIQYLRKIGHMTGRTNKEITEMFNKKFNQNRTITSIIGIKSRHGIRSYTRTYTDEQIEYLRQIAPGRTNKEITRMFNEKFNEDRSEPSIKSIRNKHGIKTGNTGRFEKGNSPANTMPVGTEIVRDDGYLYVKIKEPNVWKQKHRIIWEEHNGPVPENHVVLFGDGNKMNFDINNLILISQAQLLELNRHDLISDDVELTKTGIIIADIYRKIGERSRKKKKKGD